MNIDRKTVICLIAGMALGWAVFDGGSPFTPMKPDRPVLRFLAKAAKSMLWVMMFAEPPPAEPGMAQTLHRTVDGEPAIDHARAL